MLRRMVCCYQCRAGLLAWLVLSGVCLRAETFPLIFQDGFESGSSRWSTTDPPGENPVWMSLSLPKHGRANHVFRVTGPSAFQPPHRSPYSIAWLKDLSVTDFVMEVSLQSTNRAAGGHRDLCLFWGRQDASRFYYAHLGAKADPHACQIFVVDNAPRVKITTVEALGTPWTEDWHRVRVERTVRDGRMAVYFDDMEKPMMEARDKRFTWGLVGLGTFDDHGNFDEFVLRGSLRK